MWSVVYHPEAEAEYRSLSTADRRAIDNAVKKLESYGPVLPYPHQSAVRGSKSLRELRPRCGRSRVRPLYQRFADTFVIAAIGPEAQVDSRRFDPPFGRQQAGLPRLRNNHEDQRDENRRNRPPGVSSRPGVSG